MNRSLVWVLLLLFGAAWTATVVWAAQLPTVEDVERRAFLAGAAARWQPRGDRWTFDGIDRSDPDWEMVFQLWRKAEPQ